ncbi:hypothetical protein CCR87_08040 [Rhodobaculum claviforme]|uniref:Uncharacterized protein n=2 Tax=Rhodobaculum claviforme TaxID=1549854 RepID=A0A934WIT4_9RHOB|nr:hypothetical protein [Rhodobaculum claviforme]
MHSPQEIWQDQSAATVGILHRFGRTAAFDDLVGKKLLTFTAATTTRPDFARQLPMFVSRIRGIFPRDTINTELLRVAQRLIECVRAAARNKDLSSSASTDLAAFRQVDDLPTTPSLGTA